MGRRPAYLSTDEAAAVYDRIGRWQDTQSFYERPAATALLRAGRFDQAHDVVEIGPGTGALAERLLADHLPGDAQYHGLDVSPRMVGLARVRIRPWADRAEVGLLRGAEPWPLPDHASDRVVASYVLDLLSPDATAHFFAEAARVLTDDGFVVLAGLAPGVRGTSRLVSTAWRRVWQVDPRLTGGCRPVELEERLPPDWEFVSSGRVVAWGVCSGILTARPARP